MNPPSFRISNPNLDLHGKRSLRAGLFTAALVALPLVNPAGATPLYWDTNGTTAGAGATPTGTWATNNYWNSDATGGAGGSFTTATTSGDSLTFVAGAAVGSGNNAYTVTLNGNQSALGLTFVGTGAATIGLTAGAQTIALGTGGISLPNVAYGTTANSLSTTVNANLSLTGDQTFSNLGGSTAALTINGSISGTANLTLTGNNLKVFSAANSYVGTTTINSAGTLTLSGAAGSAGTGNIIINNASAGLNFNQSANFTLANNITGLGGSSAVQQSGATTVTLTGTNTYTGGTTIRSGGAISVASINSNLGTGAIRLGVTTTTGTLIYTGAGETTNRAFQLGGSTGGGGKIQSDGTGALVITSGVTANTGSKTLTLQGTNTGNNEIQGAILDSGGVTSLAKAGVGKWILSGTNTYSGTTTVSAGKLFVNNDPAAGSGTGSGAVMVQTGATLGGSGKVGGAAIFNSGSILSPGNSAGMLTFGSGLTLNNSGAGSLLFDLGTSSDKVTVGAALTLNGQDFNSFTFDTSGGGFGAGTYILFDASSVIGGSLGSLLTSTQFTGYNAILSLDNTNNDLILTVAVVPEPGTWALVLGGLATLVMVQRRRMHRV